MKKRLFTVLIAVAMAVACIMGLVACGDDASSVNGTYDVYSCNTETKVCATNGQTYILKDGKVTVTFPGSSSESITAEYEVEDGNIVFNMGGQKGTYKKKDNYYYMSMGDSGFIAICKQGETPKGFTVDSSAT